MLNIRNSYNCTDCEYCAIHPDYEMTRYFCGYKKPKIWFENICVPKNYNRLPHKREVCEGNICDLFKKTKPFTIPINKVVQEIAIKLAKEYAENNPNLIRVHWFSHYKDVNIITVEKNYITSVDKKKKLDYIRYGHNDNQVFWGTVSEQDDRNHDIKLPFGQQWEDAITIWEKD